MNEIDLDEIERDMLLYIMTGEQYSLSEVDFVNNDHKKIIKAINELKAQKKEINIITINEKVKNSMNDSLKYLADLTDSAFLGNPDTAYSIIKKNTKKRQLLTIALQIQANVRNTDDPNLYIEQVIDKLQKIEFQDEKEDNFVTQVCKTIDNIEKRLNKEKDYSYYTGFFDLDGLTDGLHKGELTVIGARPAVGKTTFALQIAEHIAEKGKKVAFVSMEMSDEQLIQKILSKRTSINSRKIRNGDLSEDEIQKLIAECIETSELPISILTKVNSIQQIELEARRMKNKDNLDLLIIDYLQLVRNMGNFKNREQEVADISRTLKLLSLELEIPIIALCQLNRNASKNEPTLADIRESGAIEQDADNVIFLYKENPENNLVTIDLQKQRSGNTGLSKLIFRQASSEFVNIER